MFIQRRVGPLLVHLVDRASATAHLGRSVAMARLSPADREWRIGRAAYYRDLWTAAAAEIGAAVVTSPDATLELSRGDRVVRIRETSCSIESREALERAGDKELVARLLADAGLPVPPHQIVTLGSLEDARGFVASTPGPFVVKPAGYTGGGQGVTTNVRTWRDLRRAAVHAAAAGARAGRIGRGAGALGKLRAQVRAVQTVPLLVQRQMPGVNYRMLYLDGVLIDVVRRDAPLVTGDGSSTVAALIEAVNAAGVRGGLKVRRDLDLEQTLAAQGLSWSAVPASGRTVALKTTINENAQISNFPAVDELSAAVIEEGRRAADVLGVRLAGVDILTDDPSRPLGTVDGCILEVNTTPGLAMHYHGHPGEVPVATALLRQMLAPSTPQSVT